MMKLIERTSYLEEMKDLLHTPDIKVISGVRRSGKSKLLDALFAWLKANDSSASIIHASNNLTEPHIMSKMLSLQSKTEKQNPPGDE